MDNTIHIIFQSKGGVGKTFSAALLSEYIQSKNKKLNAYDTDLANSDFYKYKKFAASRVELFGESLDIAPKKFDALMEKLVADEGVTVMDNGSNVFYPLMSYLVENDVVSLLKEMGKKVYVHTMVGGGDMLHSTKQSIPKLAKNLPDTPIILWLNEFHGSLVSNGQNFSEDRDYKEVEEHIKGLVFLERRNAGTFGDDIKKVCEARITYAEAIDSKQFSMMEKKRLSEFKKSVFLQLDQIEF